MKGSQRILETTIRGITTKLSFALLASALVLSFLAAIQLANNSNVAYGQSTDETVFGECSIHGDGTAILILEMNNLDVGSSYYGGYQGPGDAFLRGLFDFVATDTSALVSFDVVAEIFVPVQPGTQFTFYLYQDRDNNLSTVGPEEDELVATETITCGSPPDPEPPLTEQFKNQGQCIASANASPNLGITKEDCKEAFKA